jgi:hypothetical protein
VAALANPIAYQDRSDLLVASPAKNHFGLWARPILGPDPRAIPAMWSSPTLRIGSHIAVLSI